MTSDVSRGLVLVVEDERAISDLLRLYISREGFGVHVASDGRSALSAARTMHPVAIVLDVGLPEMDGTEVCRQLRAEGNWVPILFCTARDDEVDRVLGLELGADDYITKPFSPRELVARLKAVLRRAGPTDGEAPIEVGGLLLDPISHRVTIDGKPAEMGPTEYRLLQFFMTHQERAYTRGQLLDQVWGGNVYVEERTVDVHIRRLRKALGDAYENLVQTVRGTGYRFSTKA